MAETIAKDGTYLFRRDSSFMSSADSVDAPSAAVQAMSQEWGLVDDLCGGTKCMRAAGKKWLPQRVRELDAFYERRLSGSFLYEALSDTVDSVAQKPFSKATSPTGEMPEEIVALWQDITGDGVSMTSFGKSMLESAAKYGLSHVLVDYPPTIGTDAESGEEVDLVPSYAPILAGEVRPYFVLIEAPAVLGWQWVREGGKIVLDEIRWKECVTKQVGTFGEQIVERIRVYTRSDWRVYEKGGEKEGWVIVEQGINSLGKVPLVTFYTARTNYMTAKPPFMDLAWLNLRHWQSSSMQTNILDIARVPILEKVGYSDSENDESKTISANVAFISHNTDAHARWVEIGGASIAAGERDLQSLREQMEIQGLQPWLQRLSGAPATGIASNDSKMVCQVQAWVMEQGNVLMQALRLMCEWLKIEMPEDAGVYIFNDFGVNVTGQGRADRLITMRSKSQITHKTFLEGMKALGDLPETLDVEKEEAAIKAEGPPLGALEDDPFKQDPNADPSKDPAQDDPPTK